jgi:hypothetical protein
VPTVTPQPLAIDYESEGFPVGGPVSNGFNVLQTSWDELLWAAVTVGRPNRQYVFRHGGASVYELCFDGHLQEWHWSKADQLREGCAELMRQEPSIHQRKVPLIIFSA